MSTIPNISTNMLRPELTPMPARIAELPVYRGYPVPWFVAYPEATKEEPYKGEPEFRIADRH